MDIIEGRPTTARLNELVNENFTRVDNSLTSIQKDLAEMRATIIENLLNENKKLQEKVKNLEKKMDQLEVASESTNQYGRRNNIEISGIPNNVEDEALEGKVIEIFGKINIKIQKKDVEACHRLPPPKNKPRGNKKVIVRFVNRKNVENALRAKKKLSELDMNSLGFNENSALYFNENLNRYFKYLDWRCRELRSAQIIDSFKYQNEVFVIKFKKNGRDITKKISREQQLFELFIDFYEAVQ